MLNEIIHGDCLEEMKRIPDASIDMILCDLPYGTTKNKWDTVICLEELWKQYNRVIKDNGAIVLTASQPFTSVLVSSNIKNFRYEWLWLKNRGSNFAVAKKQPMKEHESVLVFYKKFPTYNAQMIERSESGKSRVKYKFKPDDGVREGFGNENSSSLKTTEYREVTNKNMRNPRSYLKFNCEVGLHPTQKPVKLFEYMIKTYTNENDIVLDNCIGSGTTAVAAINLNRNFIGIEQDENYVNIARKRISDL